MVSARALVAERQQRDRVGRIAGERVADHDALLAPLVGSPRKTLCPDDDVDLGEDVEGFGVVVELIAVVPDVVAAAGDVHHLTCEIERR